MTECKRCERTLQLNSTKFITAKAARFGLCYWCWKDLTPEQRKTYLEDYNPFTDEHAIAKDRKTIEKLNIEYREICKCDNPKPTMGYIETCSKCNISRPKKNLSPGTVIIISIANFLCLILIVTDAISQSYTAFGKIYLNDKK